MPIIISSKYSDVEIPSNVSIGELILRKTAKYGDKVALVSSTVLVPYLFNLKHVKSLAFGHTGHMSVVKLYVNNKVQ